MASNLCGPPVSVVASGGRPFINVGDLSKPLPIMTPVTGGKSMPITLVSAGAPPINLVNADGTLWTP